MSGEASARVAAFDAVVRKAIDEARDSGYSYYGGSSFRTGEVAELLEQDVGDRTLRRALHDAAALGWVEDKRNKWKPGPRAEAFVPADDVDALEDALEDAQAGAGNL